MADGKGKEWFKPVLQFFVGGLMALIAYGFFEKLVLSRVASHLENLIYGENK